MAWIALQSEAVVIAGEFTEVGGRPQVGLARLHPDGSLDGSFQPPMPAGFWPQWTAGVALRPDGRIVYAATFHDVNMPFQTNVLLQFVSDGTPDASFQPGDLLVGFNTGVDRLVAQPDGKVLLSGVFGGNRGLGLVRMNGDGSLDPTFRLRLPDQQEGSGASVGAMALQPDGWIVVDVGYLGTDYRWRYGLFRLNSDGSVDPTFSAQAGHTDVRMITVVVHVFLAIAYKDRLERFFRSLHERYLRHQKRDRGGE